MKYLSILFMNVILVSALSAQIKSKIRNTTADAIESNKAIYLNTIDPATTSIIFKIIKLRTGDRLQIIGVVKNIGGKNSGQTAINRISSYGKIILQKTKKW